jgi:hypothetical protein
MAMLVKYIVKYILKCIVCYLIYCMLIEGYLMVARNTCGNVGDNHFNYDTSVHYDYKCLNCAESERQLNEMYLELSSLQFIVKLLYKEINSNISTSNMACSTNQPSSSSSSTKRME